MTKNPGELLPITSSFLPEGFLWPESHDGEGELLPLALLDGCPPFLPDLARLEWTVLQIGRESIELIDNKAHGVVNPTLEVLPVGWSGLPELLHGEPIQPRPHEGHVAVFLAPGEKGVQVRALSGHDLLAMKIVAERLDRREVASSGNISLRMVDAILAEGRRKGLIHLPSSRIIRTGSAEQQRSAPSASTQAEVFTLQWHLTQKCDLHCRHCYDRSDRTEMTVEQADRVLNLMYDFCEYHRVEGQVSFSGGNPLLYPHFDHVYREAVRRGFLTAVRGNPAPRHRLEAMMTIQPPEYFQVSLEGLEEHNDYIRGKGHFRRVVQFLELLRELKIYSLVMLTLTRYNMDDVLPLCEFLRDRVDMFNFNRLSPTGEGASLETVPVDSYSRFLENYHRAAEGNPIMGLKDNLFNIVRARKGAPLTGGCTGFGCGAAFNFVSLLPDGEVHACRKFPSLIGNIKANTLTEIYQSAVAQKYRQGSSACSNCRIQHLCRGCPAVVYGSGGEIFTDRDPYCFMDREE